VARRSPARPTRVDLWQAVDIQASHHANQGIATVDLTALRTANPDHWFKAAAIRALTLDAVAAAKSGHSGMPMGMADVATVLFEKHMKFVASDPKWPDRDRFILSAGHGSMLLYSILHLVGDPQFNLTEIKNFRQLGARTAGHPEKLSSPMRSRPPPARLARGWPTPWALPWPRNRCARATAARSSITAPT
jgi:hypothetical protein